MDPDEEIAALKAALAQYARWGKNVMKGMSLLAPQSLIVAHLESDEAELHNLAAALCAVG